MVSVTQRIAEVKQPRGGYLPIKQFNVIKLDDGIELKEENVSGSTVGLVVDYLTRLSDTGDAEEAFRDSLLGAKQVDRESEARVLIDKIKGTDDESIINACKLVGFDTYTRAHSSNMILTTSILINPRVRISVYLSKGFCHSSTATAPLQ